MAGDFAFDSLISAISLPVSDAGLDLAVETIQLLLRKKYDETENHFGHAQILQLLKSCLKTYFTFNGTIHEQVEGTPMVSPISGLIAEAVLQRFESPVYSTPQS
ncbi:unnamed protein product [Dibothriocephalus latus]|uniref:Uncharacterized protein n=1 Tax=Dibothriocephalus latus TaxID=60516 RepID=A0A3P6U9S2_DIBLA|nr:unnamed protein product [Dibothriocephalus latus]